VARHQGALQTNCDGRGMGDYSAACDDARLYAFLQSIRRRFFKRNSVSDLCLHGAFALDVFANAVSNCSISLVNNSNLITKVYFPRLLIPAAAVAAGLVDLAIASIILVGLALYYGLAVTWSGLLMLLSTSR
jgi:lipopolysaccharide transport system permease protein